MAEFELIRVRTQSEMLQALQVRRRVFIEEQGVPEAEEIDEHDRDPASVSTAVHVLLRRAEQPVATGRLLWEHEDGRVHIGRVAVLAEYRRVGHGRTIMQALHSIASERGVDAITLAAQLHAIGFYERLGYIARGNIFLDAGIEHRWMDLALTGRAGRPPTE